MFNENPRTRHGWQSLIPETPPSFPPPLVSNRAGLSTCTQSRFLPVGGFLESLKEFERLLEAFVPRAHFLQRPQQPLFAVEERRTHTGYGTTLTCQRRRPTVAGFESPANTIIPFAAKY